MVTKQDLRDYKNLQKELQQVRRQMIELELLAISPKAQALTGMPGGGGCSGVADLAIKILDVQLEYEHKQEETLTELQRIQKDVEQLPFTERQLIKNHYFFGMSWEGVAIDMGYSLRQVHNLHSKALQILSKL